MKFWAEDYFQFVDSSCYQEEVIEFVGDHIEGNNLEEVVSYFSGYVPPPWEVDLDTCENALSIVERVLRSGVKERHKFAHKNGGEIYFSFAKE